MLGLCCSEGFSPVAASRGYSVVVDTGFPLQWRLLLWSTDLRCFSFSSCSMEAQ